MSARKALSPRQRQVLRLIGRGYTDKGIADSLGIKIPTVSTHVAAIMRRLNCNSRSHAVFVFLEGD